MVHQGVPSWRKAPFIRLLIPLILGICFQWYYPAPVIAIEMAIGSSLAAGILYSLLPLPLRFRLAFVYGFAHAIILMGTGALLVFVQDVRNNKSWLGHQYQQGDKLIIQVTQPPEEKQHFLRTTAAARYIARDHSLILASGNLILYLEKDGCIPFLKDLQYGSLLVITAPVQPIPPPRNPGEFDYAHYSLFQGITHQAFVDCAGMAFLPAESNRFDRFILFARDRLLTSIRKYIPGPVEQGLAEALLIGYKNDLDPALVQSYSKTGVVHIIAISGLHIGLIYWLLLQACRPLQRKKHLKIFIPLFVIAGLWIFSLMAGAQPSVLRSALMFTCIAAGDWAAKKTTTLNSLALSAFLLLCYDPFWLWDAGFQLSYTAVLSIILFQQRIYHCYSFHNKLLDALWKLCAVTLAAQVLTTPVSIYLFHQFPVYFLITNLVAVPLSTLIVLGEIGLCLLGFVPTLAKITGNILSMMIHAMNAFIERMGSLPFDRWSDLQIDPVQVIFLYLLIGFIHSWLLSRNARRLMAALLSLFFFMLLRMHSFIRAGRQHFIIVYCIPAHRAIDFVAGRKYYFIGDGPGPEINNPIDIKLAAARSRDRRTATASLSGYYRDGNCTIFRGKRILLVNSNPAFKMGDTPLTIDLLVISGNTRFNFQDACRSFIFRQVVFDASVPFRNRREGMKICAELGIPVHDVTSGGAFLLHVN